MNGNKNKTGEKHKRIHVNKCIEIYPLALFHRQYRFGAIVKAVAVGLAGSASLESNKHPIVDLHGHFL